MKMKVKENPYRQNFTHGLSCGATEPLAELEESLQVRLVQSVPDNLNVHLVQVLLANAVHEEWSYKDTENKLGRCT